MCGDLLIRRGRLEFREESVNTRLVLRVCQGQMAALSIEVSGTP